MKMNVQIFLVYKAYNLVLVQPISTVTLHTNYMKNSIINFKKVENEIQLLTCPFIFILQQAPDNLQMKLSDLQNDTKIKEKLNFRMHATMFLVAK